MEFETFTRMKEYLRIKSKTSLEKTGNMETEASVLFNRNTSTTPTWTHVQTMFKHRVQNRVENHDRNRVENSVQNCVQNLVQNCVQSSVQKSVQNRVRKIKKDS